MRFFCHPASCAVSIPPWPNINKLCLAESSTGSGFETVTCLSDPLLFSTPGPSASSGQNHRMKKTRHTAQNPQRSGVHFFKFPQFSRLFLAYLFVILHKQSEICKVMNLYAVPLVEARNSPSFGQKFRCCPETGAGTENLSRFGQKFRCCPQTGAGTENLSHRGRNSSTHGRHIRTRSRHIIRYAAIPAHSRLFSGPQPTQNYLKPLNTGLRTGILSDDINNQLTVGLHGDNLHDIS